MQEGGEKSLSIWIIELNHSEIKQVTIGESLAALEITYRQERRPTNSMWKV